MYKWNSEKERKREDGGKGEKRQDLKVRVAMNLEVSTKCKNNNFETRIPRMLIDYLLSWSVIML